MAKDNQDVTQEQDTSALEVKDAKKTKAIETSEPQLPKEVIMLSRYVLSLRMPGQDVAVTKSFREGQVVVDPESIKNLMEAGAPIRILG